MTTAASTVFVWMYVILVCGVTVLIARPLAIDLSVCALLALQATLQRAARQLLLTDRQLSLL